MKVKMNTTQRILHNWLMIDLKKIRRARKEERALEAENSTLDPYWKSKLYGR
jgi:hypothetical protein